jgi:hypothetical protein
MRAAHPRDSMVVRIRGSAAAGYALAALKLVSASASLS